MAKHWTDTHQKALEQYYYCTSATTSAETRSYLISNYLLEPIKATIHKAISTVKLSLLDNEDLKADILTHIYSKTLNKIKPDKIKATLQLIFTAARNKTITYVKSFNYNAMLYSSDVSTIDWHYSNDNDYEIQTNKEEIHNRVLIELDNRIEYQKGLKNKSNVVFLVLFKFYLLDNQFDERGFSAYCMEKMNISYSTFRSIASRCKIKSKPLTGSY